MSGVFISYRREDTRAWAINLREHLARTLGDHQVFLDVDSMDAGHWRGQIERALDRCAVVVVLVGRHWAEASDATGRKRLFRDDDVHRTEIVSALRRPGITVIPVLVDGARLPDAGELPEDVGGILECQASEIADAGDVRSASLRRLVRSIDDVLGHRRERRRAAAAAVASVAAGVVNTLVVSKSPIVATAFLVAAACLGFASVHIYRRMVREHIKGAWVALLAVVLSAGMMVGSIVRLVVTASPGART